MIVKLKLTSLTYLSMTNESPNDSASVTCDVSETNFSEM